MEAKVINISDDVKCLKIDLTKDGQSISEAFDKYFSDNDDDDKQDKIKQLHDSLVNKLILIRDAVKFSGVPAKLAIAKGFKNINSEEDHECYCPRCLAIGAASLTTYDIVEIGADIVEALFDKYHKHLSIKTKRDLKAIENVMLRAKAMNSSTDKSKPIEDMSREELIAELKKKGK